MSENVILRNVREITKDDDAILEEAADTTAKQLADGWLTWANIQQPPTTSQPPKNTEQKHCDLASCAPQQWQLSVQTKEMKASGLDLSFIVSFLRCLTRIPLKVMNLLFQEGLQGVHCSMDHSVGMQFLVLHDLKFGSDQRDH